MKIELIYFRANKKETIKNLMILKKIISGSIDADRMDYLLRDSLHCGVEYGRYDYQRLIECLGLIYSDDTGYDLCIEHGGIHTLESMILARYYMFTQVYCHKTRRIYDHYLCEIMKSWYEKNVVNMLDVIRYDDIAIINYIKEVLNDVNGEQYEYAYRIRYRKHHSVIYETSDFCKHNERKKAKKIFEKLQELYPNYDFILIETKGTIHNFVTDKAVGDEEEGEEFYVIRNNKPYLLSDESHVIKNIPKRFFNVRIYISKKGREFERLSKEEIEEFKKEAEKIGEGVL